MGDLSPEKLDELEALAKAARPGPWSASDLSEPEEFTWWNVLDAQGFPVAEAVPDDAAAQLMAAARDALPALLAEVVHVRDPQAASQKQARPGEKIPLDGRMRGKAKQLGNRRAAAGQSQLHLGACAGGVNTLWKRADCQTIIRYEPFTDSFRHL